MKSLLAWGFSVNGVFSEDFNLFLWLSEQEGMRGCGPTIAQLVEPVIQMAVWMLVTESDCPHVPVDKTKNCDEKNCETLQLAVMFRSATVHLPIYRTLCTQLNNQCVTLSGIKEWIMNYGKVETLKRLFYWAVWSALNLVTTVFCNFHS